MADYGTTACKWDSVIPLEPLWKECKRVIKPNGAIVLFGNQPFTSVLILSTPDWFKYETIWSKKVGSSPGLARYRPLPSHETILVFGKGTLTFNPQMRTGFKPWKKQDTGKVLRNDHKYGYANKPVLKTGTNERYPLSVLEFVQVKGAEKQLHPTQKPVKLLEYLIKTYTNPGDLVLDNTFGSCSTGVACLNTGRRFIGIEKDPDYFRIGQERMERVERELRGEQMELSL